jgi:hypothetical protein
LFKKALQSSFWVENGALWELRLLNLNVIDIDLFVHFSSWCFGKIGIFTLTHRVTNKKSP